MKWFPLVGGIIALLAGFYLFINPVTVVATLGWFIALFIFIYGISNLVRYLQADSYHRSPWYLVQSILAIIFGIILLSSSAMSLSNTVMTILAYWLLVSGILRLLGGFQMQKINVPGAKSYKRSAYIALILGIILLVQPTLSAAIIGRFVAFILIAIGASAIYTFTRINY
ncbi:TPA: HdeD family acid-resistance protein [Streptococcus agalactiae]